MRPLVLVLIAAALGCGTATVGCGTSEPEKEDFFALAEEFLATTAYLPSYQRCVREEAERLVSPSQLREVMALPTSEQFDASTTLLEPATLECKRADPQIVDPDATSQELKPIKLLTAKALAAGVLEGGATPAQSACVERRFERLSDAATIRFGNASRAAQLKQAEPVVLPCLR